MKNFIFYLLAIFMMIFVAGCKTQSTPASPMDVVEGSFPPFLHEGHRGARGLMPENTIPSMIKAIEEGSNVIELDVHVSKDNRVVVAHDPYINREFSLMPNGEEIPKEDEKKYLIYQMDYSEIRQFDVGSKFRSEYPDQKKMKAYIPLLGELIDSVEQFISDKKYPSVIYNIEVKAEVDKDGFYQPTPEKFINLVMEVVKGKNLNNNRYYLQSFDIRQIQQVNKNYPDVVTGFLTSNKDMTFEENLQKIGFIPQIYSPNFNLAKPELIEKSHQKGMKFVPWTVNEITDMERLIQMGVDGIITDYPDRLTDVLRK